MHKSPKQSLKIISSIFLTLVSHCTFLKKISEGIFQGDVTNPASLIAPTAGVSAVAICVGSGAGVSVKEQAAIEWHGVESQLKELVYNGSKVSHS